MNQGTVLLRHGTPRDHAEMLVRAYGSELEALNQLDKGRWTAKVGFEFSNARGELQARREVCDELAFWGSE